MDFKSLKEKCEYYKDLADYRLLPNSYVLFHLDGRAFSKMVKNKFEKPFDKAFTEMMNKTMVHLCEKLQGVVFAYCQSDEISLVMRDFSTEGLASSSFFSYRLCKMQSIAASMATAKFNNLMTRYRLGEVPSLFSGDMWTWCAKKVEDMPLYEFDCKAWNVPSANDAYAWMLYRQHDCLRNSKQQFAQTYLPHNKLVGHDSDEQVRLTNEATGNDWNAIDDGWKYGRICLKKVFMFENPEGGQYERTKWVAENAQPFDKDFNEGDEYHKIINLITK